MIHEIPGNANRFAHELNRQGYHQNEIDHLAKQFAKIKQDIYIKKYLPELELRPGVENILQEAVARKIPLGIVSGISEITLEHRLGMIAFLTSSVWLHCQIKCL